MLKARVMVIDSGREFRSYCSDELKKRGIEVISDACEADEAFMQIIKCKPDIVITEIYIGKSEASELIKASNKQLGGQSPHFIVLSDYYNQNLFEECCESGAAYCMIRPLDFELLAERVLRLYEKKPLNNIMETEKLDFEEQITKLFHQMGIPAHIKGYNYMRKSIILAIKDGEIIKAVTKILYPTIAKIYNTTPSRVERSIRHAIELAWDRGNLEMIDSLFGYTINSNRGKPTNSEFIAMITDHIRIKNRITTSELKKK